MKQQPVVKHQASADLFLVSVCLDTERNYGMGRGKDADMFSCMDKNSPESDSVLGPTGDKRTNKWLCLA